ncbi:methionine synthase [Pilimelia columellifera]|uniref:Methionine synthase n=1 Tax=Pilimelia columellifera subsp. columellifera TaxID=706583 RepID=A0ABP6AS28_9ACTN
MNEQWPWPAGAATGIGSLPGVDITEAQKIVLGELPDLPHLPELPARGPGADLIGRGAGLLVDLPVELYAGRWQVTSRPGRDLRRAHDLLDRDLDQLTEQADGYRGVLKIQAAGPWTLAASVQRQLGGPLLADPGAVRDLASSLTEGLRRHVAQVRARVPDAAVILQLDEPSLPAVLAARVPTESGLATLRAVAANTAAERLRDLIGAVDAPVVVHCCAPDVPLALLRSAGAAAVAVDLDLLKDLDALGAVLDDGMGLFAGVLAPAGDTPVEPKALAERVLTVWRDLSFAPDRLARQVVLTPSCGLVGVSAPRARAVLAACRQGAVERATGLAVSQAGR